MCVGIVLHRLGSVNETSLHGRGRRLRVTGVVFTLAALGLADLPPFATFLGKGWIEDSGDARGLTWITVVLMTCSVLVGGAVLRVAGGVFYGLGDPPTEIRRWPGGLGGDQRDRERGKRRTPLSMIVPAALVAVAASLSRCCRTWARGPGSGRAVPGPGGLQRHRAVRVRTSPTRGLCRSGEHRRHRGRRGDRCGLGRRRSRPRLGRPLLATAARSAAGFEPGTGLVRPIRRFQSGVINDYVTWIVVAWPASVDPGLTIR